MKPIEYTTLAQRDFRAQTALTLYQMQNNTHAVVMQTQVLSYEPGMKNLNAFSLKQQSFQQLEPFILDPQTRIHRQRYIGHINHPTGNETRLLPQTPAMLDVFRRGNSLLTIPLENQLHRWVDFYEVEAGNKVNIQKKVDTLLLDKQTNKIIADRWFGPEREAFFDHLAGLDVPEALYTAPFLGIVRGATDIIELGSYHGVSKYYRVQHQQLKNGDTIQFHKETDGTAHWLLGELIENGEPSRAVFSEQIIYDENGRGHLREWYIGIRDVTERPKVHALVQGILGRSPIPFADIPQVTLTVPEGKKIHLANQRNFPDRPQFDEEYAINVNLANYDVKPGEKVDLIPRSDPRGFYDWIAIVKDGKELGTKWVTRWKTDKLDGRWLGPARQAYGDFMMQTEFPQGKLTLADLPETEMVVTQTGLMTICKTIEQEKIHYYSVSLGNPIQGQLLRFSPYLNDSNQLSFILTDAGTHSFVSQYEYDALLHRYKKITTLKNELPPSDEETIANLLKGAQSNPKFVGYT